MYMTKMRAVFILAVIGIVVGGVAIYSNATASVNADAHMDSVPVWDFQDHGGVMIMNPQQRGTSKLVRTLDGISMNIDTMDLPVGAYSTWWVVFNNPAGCSDGICGENDVLPPPGNPDASVSVLWGTGGTVGPDRMGHFSANLAVGEVPGQLLFGDGVTNPMGAEVHVIVRYHGPTIWDDANIFHAQITDFGGACTADSSLGFGVGTFGCYDAQVAVHQP